MSLKTLVKVGEISNLSDARYCAGMGVEMLGFNLNPNSPKYTSPEVFKELTEWIAGVKLVGEFQDLEISEIKLALSDYHLEYIQIENLDLLEQVATLGPKIIFKLNINQLETLYNLSNLLELISEHTDEIIIASSNKILFEQIENDLENLSFDLKLFKGFNVSTDNISHILSQKYSGIALIGGEEDRPGFNDYADLMDILEALDEY